MGSGGGFIDTPKKICTFFGHSDTSTEIRPALYAEIEKHITLYGVDIFYVGGYGNFDGMASSILREMEKKYPHIEVCKVLAYIPGKKSKYAPSRDENTIYPEGLETVPKKFAITHRNRWMVEQSDYLIFYVRMSYGGAYDAMQYAHRKVKKIINLADSEI